MPESLLCCSSKEYARYPLNNKPNNDSKSSSVAAPSNTMFYAQQGNVAAVGGSLGKYQNEEMELKTLSFLEDEVAIPDQEHPCAQELYNPAKQPEYASLSIPYENDKPIA